MAAAQTAGAAVALALGLSIAGRVRAGAGTSGRRGTLRRDYDLWTD